MTAETAGITNDAFLPRPYQADLLEKAKDENIIVPLGTGTGKTYIAVLLIRELADEIRDYGESAKRTFFLVDKVGLVGQQAALIRRETNLKVAELCGRTFDGWGQDRWTPFLMDSNVFVMTAQIFLNMLWHGFYNIQKANLIIFDECHHALGDNHAYRQILRNHYQPIANELVRPKILGLTASLVNDRVVPRALPNRIAELEKAMFSKVCTTNELISLSMFAAKPVIFLVQFPVRPLYSLEQCIKEHLDSVKSRVQLITFNEETEIEATKPCEEALRRCCTVLEKLGIWCCWKVARIKEKQLLKLRDSPLLSDETVKFIDFGLTCLRFIRHLTEPLCTNVKCLSDLLRISPPKLRRLLSILLLYKGRSCCNETRTEQQSNSEEFSGLVFVQERYTAFALKIFLQLVCRLDPENFGFLKVDYVVGVAGDNMPSEADQLSLYWRLDDIMQKFRNKELNLLVATNVLEEGIDVRQCNVVIRMEPPDSFRSFVQSKGRARKKDSRVFILADEESAPSHEALLKDYLRMETMLLKHCVRSSDSTETAKVDVTYLEIRGVGYMVNSTGARVTAANAIPVLNSYCGCLPADKFTRLSPKIVYTEVDAGATSSSRSVQQICYYTATLKLPLNSALKEEIKYTEPMPSKKYAQIAVTIEAIKMLHECGELDDHLLPTGKNMFKHDVDIYEEQSPALGVRNNTTFSGTRKLQQLFRKKVASVLQNCNPLANQDVFISLINITDTTALTHPSNSVYNNNTQVLGFLSSCLLPEVPRFSLYTIDGEISVELVNVPNPIRLSAENVEKLWKFHRFLFTDILHLPFFNLDFASDISRSTVSGICCLLIAPLIKTQVAQFSIDWNFVGKTLDIVDDCSVFPYKPSEAERKYQFRFDPSRYDDAIVSPWYRKTRLINSYRVLCVLNDVHPTSKFPLKDFANYVDYFATKHEVTIFHLDQPLLAVDYLPTRLNLLKNQCYNNWSSLDSDCALYSKKQVLVPELVDIHPVPGKVWKIVVCLPSICYRLNGLLLADELRCIIQREAFHTDPNPLIDVTPSWEPLSLDRFGAGTRLPSRSLHDCANRVEDHLLVAEADDENCDHLKIKLDVYRRTHKRKTVNAVSVLGAQKNKPACKNLNLKVVPAGQISPPCGQLAEDEDSLLVEEAYLSSGGIFRFLGRIKSKATKDSSAVTEPASGVDDLIQCSESLNAAPALLPSHVSDLDPTTTSRSKPVDPLGFGSSDYVKVSHAESSSINSEPYSPSVCSNAVFSNSIQRTAVSRFLPTFSESNGVDVSRGPSPCAILKALTLLKADDGINLERFEVLGDSFLKLVSSLYLFASYPKCNEGLLTAFRSKETCNYNLYRLGKLKGLGELIVADRFDPKENWLPPGYLSTYTSGLDEACSSVEADTNQVVNGIDDGHLNKTVDVSQQSCSGIGCARFVDITNQIDDVMEIHSGNESSDEPILLPAPVKALDEQIISMKSVADCVEALIAVYLLHGGPSCAVKFMHWLGLYGQYSITPMCPLINPAMPLQCEELSRLWIRHNFDEFESILGYHFTERAYLVEALTHVSYHYNFVTNCYQRLEFLGDAVLDYVVTHYYFFDPNCYSPGALSDLRSATCCNFSYAKLAVEHKFHKFMLAICPSLYRVVDNFVKRIAPGVPAVVLDETYLFEEGDCDLEDDVEVPKALSDIFEAVAGAIFLDSGCNLLTVVEIYVKLMQRHFEQYSRHLPKPPVRRLFEQEPESRFTRVERNTADGRVRTTLEVPGKGTFVAVGKNYKYAKNSVAKQALRCLVASSRLCMS